MASARPPLKLAVAGLGAIGLAVARRVDAGELPGVVLSAAAARDHDKARKATASFLGRIEVAREGQRTDAEQSVKAMLLDRGATANCKPELEIFADDVKCAHGAAIGQMDEMAGYYMAARGIPPEVARKLLVRAFIADAFVALEDEDEQEKLLNAALDALGDAA